MLKKPHIPKEVSCHQIFNNTRNSENTSRIFDKSLMTCHTANETTGTSTSLFLTVSASSGCSLVSLGIKDWMWICWYKWCWTIFLLSITRKPGFVHPIPFTLSQCSVSQQLLLIFVRRCNMLWRSSKRSRRSLRAAHKLSSLSTPSSARADRSFAL